MSNTINYGIDLGTTNSAIAKYTEGKVEVFKNPLNWKQTLPSVVAFRKGRLIVGDKAREVMQKDPLNVIGAFKRKMGTSDKYLIQSTMETHSAEDLSAIILKELKNFIPADETMDAAVITIPASFDTMQSNATKKAGYQAGFQQVVLLQEPIAASLAYANKDGVDLVNSKWLVYDFGGGTFDVALVSINDEEMKVLDHEGNNYLGGTDFDKAVVEKIIIPHLEKEGKFENLAQEMKSASGKYNRLYHLLLFKAEEAKIMLTNASETEIEFETEDDTGEELDIFLTISRDELNAAIQPLIKQTLEMMDTVMQRNHLNNSDLKFILMIGGSTYVPAVREQIKQDFGLNINYNIDPTTAVAEGAAYYAGMKQKVLPTENTATNTGMKSGAKVASHLDIKVAYSKVAQEAETAFIARINGDITGQFYRITRTDLGYDSGLKPLAQSLTEYLPLVANSYNEFNFKVFDKLNNPVAVNVPAIGITHGKFSIDGQPLPNDICLEVDATAEKTTFLEPIFKKNAILPVKKTIVKEISRHIMKGTDDALIINILEGPVDSLAAANKTIGYVKINGHDLERDLIKGSDVELTFEISESRDLAVQVYLSLSDQEFENVFSPSETHIALEEVGDELRQFRLNLVRKQKECEATEDYEAAAKITTLLGEVSALEARLTNLQVDDVTDEKYQIDEAKRGIARKMHGLFNSSVLRTTLEKYYKAKKNVQRALSSGEATPEDKVSFDNLVGTEKEFLKSDNVSLIKMKISQLKGLIQRISSRRTITSNDIIGYFGYLKTHPFKDRGQANGLIQKGETALQDQNMVALTDVVNQLHWQRQREENDGSGSFQKSGTGLQ